MYNFASTGGYKPSLFAQASTNLTFLEMAVISSTGSGGMELGLDEVELLLENCPNLCILGNLRTW